MSALTLDPPRARGRHQWLTLLCVVLGVVMVGLDGTVVAIANPEIIKEFNASLADVQWVTNGYLLALAVLLITAGRLGDRFGHKKIFLIGVTGFALTSLAIGLAPDVGWLIGLRVLQGIFGALLQPTALGLLRAAFPADRLNLAVGLWTAAIAASTAAGPIVGGVLVEVIDWRAVFFINVPVGLVALVLGVFLLRDSRTADATRSFDVPGIAVLSVAMFCLVWAIIKAPELGWADPRTLGVLGAALMLMIVFGVREWRAREPLLPLRLFRSVGLSVGTVLMLLVSFALFGALFFITFHLQKVHGLTPVQTGLWLLPLTVTLFVASPLVGASIRATGPRGPIFVGMLVTAFACYGFSRLRLEASFGDMLLWFVLLGLGMSPVMVASTDVIVGNAPRRLSGVAAGLQQASMQVGAALGVSVLGTIVTTGVASGLPEHFEGLGLGKLWPEQVEELKALVSAGGVPDVSGLPAEYAELIIRAGQLAFLDGINLAFGVSAAVCAVAAVLGLFVSAPRLSGQE